MKKIMLAVVTVLTIAACDKSRDMDTRTYQLSRLTQDEALALLTPYIREGGYLSGKNKLITVREKADRLKVIDGVLKQYDGVGEALDVVMNMQVIAADGFKERDPAIADVESTLRQMFKYDGYKLLGSVRFQTREDGTFIQSGGNFRISGRLQRVSGNGDQRVIPMSVELDTKDGAQLGSTITAPLDKPTVLGQSTEKGAIILVIRPAIAPR